MIVFSPKWTEKIIAIGGISPAPMRLLVGIGALATRPAVDYYTNRKIDTETRKLSLNKALAGIVVGTATGVFARLVGFQVGVKLVESGKILKPYLDGLGKLVKPEFTKGVGQATAFLTTISTIFLLDVPLTTKSVESKIKNKSDKTEPVTVAGVK